MTDDDAPFGCRRQSCLSRANNDHRSLVPKLFAAGVASLALAVPAVVLAQSSSDAPPPPDRSTLRFDNFNGGAPGFGGRNNRDRRCASRDQDFGVSDGSTTQRDAEVGGKFTNSYERSHYSRRIRALTFDDSFRAKGRFRVSELGKNGTATAKIGFFSSRNNSRNDSPLPSSVFVSLADKRGGDEDKISIELEVASSRGARKSRFKADGGSKSVDKPDDARPYDKDQTYDYELEYDPDRGDHGAFRLEVEGGDRVEVELDEYLRRDNARLDRYGVLNGAGLNDTSTVAHVSDISINGSTESRDNLRKDWGGYRNRQETRTCATKGSFNFGYDSNSVGGLLTTTDDVDGKRASYSNGLSDDLNFGNRFYMKMRLRTEALSQDSSSYIGWFNDDSRYSSKKKDDPKLLTQFLGLQLRTKTKVLLCARPAAQGDNNSGVAYNCDTPESGSDTEAIRLSPGRTFAVEFAYEPDRGSNGTMYVRVDGRRWVAQKLNSGTRDSGVDLNRFGIHSARESGQGRQIIRIDDVTWTKRH